jgi:hypothetical protein
MVVVAVVVVKVGESETHTQTNLGENIHEEKKIQCGLVYHTIYVLI